MAVGSNNDNGWPVADSTANVGGAAGTMGLGAGTNNLQESIDRLDTTINTLVDKISGMSSGGGSAQQSGSGKSGGIPTSFPSMINPFSSNQAGPSTGIGGGGPGGAGNISPIQSFGKASGPMGIVNAFAGYGSSKMGTQLGLNAYATQTALAMGQTSNNFTAQYKQAFGFQNQNLNALASSPMDALAGTQGLQYLSSSPMYMGNQLGRAGYGATAALGMANPSMSMQQSVGLAQSIYSPNVAMNMQMMGYGVTPRKMGGGANNMAAVSQGMLRAWYGQKRVNQSTLVAGLGEGGKVNANLQAIGLNPSAFGSTLEEYNQLFNKGLNTNQAQGLINQAGKNNAAGRAAQQRLSSLGVKTATSSMQQLRNNQSAVTGRDADVASGFTNALSTATGMLNSFNTGLSGLMTKMGINGAVGGLGGALGTLAGTSGANSLLGAGSSLGTMALAAKALGIKIPGMSSLTGGNAVAKAAGATSGEGTVAATEATTSGGGMMASLGGMLGSASGGIAMGGAGAAIALLMGKAIDNALHPSVADKKLLKRETTGGWDADPRSGTGYFNIHQAGMGGGATSVATSAQSKPGSSTVQTGSVSGAAIKAVQEAKSQLGVPYVYGDMNPGVGFDCSGLVDWAYKQAGIALPRTSEAQWAFLSKRAIALNAVREGDLVFSGGADGTASDPGHVGMMISSNQLIQAPHTGSDVQIVGYNPKEWSHAGRPSGSGGGIISGSGGGTGSNGSSGTTGANQGGVMGNMGSGMASNYGSTNEVDAVSAALSGGGSGGGFYASGGSYGAAGSGSGTGGTGASTGGGKSTAGLSGNKKILNAWAAKYGWGTGQEWNSLNTLELHEAGYNNLAQNPTSTAFGMGQFLDTTWASVGGTKTSDPNLQSKYMMEYIKERYGDPNKAWSQYYQHPGGVGWYGTGGKAGEVSVVGERGPEIMVGGSGNQILDANQTAAIMKAAKAQPAQSPYSTLSENQLLNGGTPGAPGSQGQVNLNFGQGSVVINVGGTGSTSTDASKSGRAIAQQFTQWLQKEDVYDAISKGYKNG